MTEKDRIEFLVRRDGEEPARVWVERTLKLYREAIASGGYAASDAYRRLLEQSIREYEDWLRVIRIDGKSSDGAAAYDAEPREERCGGAPTVTSAQWLFLTGTTQAATAPIQWVTPFLGRSRNG